MTRGSDVLVVGGGPAGLVAATAAATAGKRVSLLDDNLPPGGQIWRRGINSTSGLGGKVTRRSLAAFERSDAHLFCGWRVVDAPKRNTLQALEESTQAVETFTYDTLILATGARERFLPFPGWMLPGVFGAVGLQALVKAGFPVRSKRVLVAGTGPLLLAVAAHLLEDGATIVAIAEQAPLRRLANFSQRLLSHPAKLAQGARDRLALRKVPYRTGCWPLEAQGTDRLTSVRLTNGRQTWTEPCDLLACGFHLVANTELASLLGCSLENGSVAVNDLQETSVPKVFCAGEPTGVAGVDAALVQGRIAGLAAAGKAAEAAQWFKQRSRERAFGRALDQAFALRPEFRSLCRPDTIVCRCEDVRYGELKNQPSWTEAKLQTRCGMGSCQGRICGPAVHTLFGWRPTSVRPPIFPVPLSAFLSEEPGETLDNSDSRYLQTQETA